MNTPPCLVWLPVDHRKLGEDGHQMPYLVLGDKYARAVTQSVRAQPVLFPLAGSAQIVGLIGLVDGVLLTGSPSNVHPSHFDQGVADPSLPLDPDRDGLTLALVRACVEQAVPLLGVCRGLQEINVALGGSLHQAVHGVPAMRDHREPAGATLEVQYGPSHAVTLRAGSNFARWAGGERAMVNSLHGQGVDRLAPGLRVEARSEDGLVEAFSVEAAAGFACAVQWHPEWRSTENPFYAALFKAFGDACGERHARRLRGT
ncbi:MAG: gamma-glutamyl-gamma-aminobutyrate hydrolase family protein [Burkholderiaceae bacterium]